MEEFCRQINLAFTTNKNVIIMGDANLCSDKWNEPGYAKKNISKILRNTLDQNDMVTQDIGITYVADHAHKDNIFSESSIDHVYNSESLSDKIVIILKIVDNKTTTTTICLVGVFDSQNFDSFRGFLKDFLSAVRPIFFKNSLTL